jgi:hypothetical protein
MSRVGGELREFTPDQKRKLADLGSIYEARIAQVKLQADTELRQLSGEPEKQDAVRARTAAEVAALTAERERKKEALRNELQGAARAPADA